MGSISIETIKTVLTKFPANDLSFSVKDQCLILIESQNKWSSHILVHLYINAALVYLSYLIRNDLDLFNLPAAWKPPEIESYVLYTGEPAELPEAILYPALYFNGRKGDLDKRVKVIYKEDHTALGQFIAFAARWREKRRQHPEAPYSAAVIHETIEQCLKEGIMREFLESERAAFEKMLLDWANVEQEIETLTKKREALAKEQEDNAVKEAIEETKRITEVETARKLLLKMVDKGKISLEEAEKEAWKSGFSLYPEV